MNADELERAVRVLVDLDRRDRAQQAAAALPDELAVADLLRAADGAQQVARALAARRQHPSAAGHRTRPHDPHDLRSLYS